VDFRELVRKLNSHFRLRVELRQIGSRDEAKIIGGYGRCGRPVCCENFLSEFSPVSIKMAKEQDLSLNPMKISGQCGRLMCCLCYENSHYRETRSKMPKVGQRVTTPSGKAVVTGSNLLKEMVTVELETGVVADIPLSKINFKKPTPGGR